SGSESPKSGRTPVTWHESHDPAGYLGAMRVRGHPADEFPSLPGVLGSGGNSYAPSSHPRRVRLASLRSRDESDAVFQIGGVSFNIVDPAQVKTPHGEVANIEWVHLSSAEALAQAVHFGYIVSVRVTNHPLQRLHQLGVISGN